MGRLHVNQSIFYVKLLSCLNRCWVESGPIHWKYQVLRQHAQQHMTSLLDLLSWLQDGRGVLVCFKVQLPFNFFPLRPVDICIPSTEFTNGGERRKRPIFKHLSRKKIKFYRCNVKSQWHCGYNCYWLLRQVQHCFRSNSDEEKLEKVREIRYNF